MSRWHVWGSEPQQVLLGEILPMHSLCDKHGPGMGSPENRKLIRQLSSPLKYPHPRCRQENCTKFHQCASWLGSTILKMLSVKNIVSNYSGIKMKIRGEINILMPTLNNINSTGFDAGTVSTRIYHGRKRRERYS